MKCPSCTSQDEMTREDSIDVETGKNDGHARYSCTNVSCGAVWNFNARAKKGQRLTVVTESEWNDSVHEFMGGYNAPDNN